MKKQFTRSIMPFGFKQGSPVIRFIDNDLLSESVEILLREDVFPKYYALLIEDDSIEYFSNRVIAEIIKHREVFITHRADRACVRLCTWKTVLVCDEAFYDFQTLDGDEAIVEPHAQHLLSQFKEMTHFDHYFVMPFDAQTECEAKEFMLSDASNGWRITKRCFDDVNTYELERMMSDG